MIMMFPETIELFPQVSLGEIDTPITMTQPGRVKALGSFWFAEFYSANYYKDLTAGTPIKVVGRKGIALLVVSKDDALPNSLLENASQKQRTWFSSLIQTVSSTLAAYTN